MGKRSYAKKDLLELKVRLESIRDTDEEELKYWHEAALRAFERYFGNKSKLYKSLQDNSFFRLSDAFGSTLIIDGVVQLDPAQERDKFRFLKEQKRECLRIFDRALWRVNKNILPIYRKHKELVWPIREENEKQEKWNLLKVKWETIGKIAIVITALIGILKLFIPKMFPVNPQIEIPISQERVISKPDSLVKSPQIIPKNDSISDHSNH